MNILSIEHLTRVYGTVDTAVTALNDVSFTVEAGEFIAIIGSSGSGKSTLMHLMGGVDRPTSGPVKLQGQDIFARNDEQLAVFRRREVGLIYQLSNLIPVLNVVENMTLPGASNKKFKKTLIVITHEEDVALMADRVIAIEDGRIVRDERRA